MFAKNIYAKLATLTVISVSLFVVAGCQEDDGGSDGIPLSSLEFADPNLAACVKDPNARPAWAIVVSDLDWMNCGNRGITDISGIEALNSLTLLSLDFNSISDVSALASFTKLYSLKLDNNNISDVGAPSTPRQRPA